MIRVSRLLCLPALLLACTSLTFLTGCGTNVENDFKVQTDLSQAQEQAQIGQLAQARLWSNRAIAVNPHALSTYVFVFTQDNQDGLGIASLGPADNGVFNSVGDNQDIITYMKQAMIALPQDYTPLLPLIEAYQMLGDKANQQATSTQLAARLEKRIAAPGMAHDETLMTELAQAYFDAGNPVKGAADFQAVIQAYPKDPIPYNSLAYSWAFYNIKSALPQALSDAKQSLALATQMKLSDDQIAPLQDTLGWVQYRSGDAKDALSNIQAAVSGDPREPVERYHLGMVYLALGQPNAARAELTHAIQLAPGYADAQSALTSLGPPHSPATTASPSAVSLSPPSPLSPASPAIGASHAATP